MAAKMTPGIVAAAAAQQQANGNGGRFSTAHIRTSIILGALFQI